MAREYKEREVTSTRRDLVKLTCDMCGREGKRGDWESSCYEVNEVEVEVRVRHKKGDSYPDGGWGDEIVVDVCPECFRKKLVPFIESFGRVKIEPKKWDY